MTADVFKLASGRPMRFVWVRYDGGKFWHLLRPKGTVACYPKNFLTKRVRAIRLEETAPPATCKACAHIFNRGRV